MTITTVTAVAEQWGAVVTITDVAELTIKHQPLQKAIMLLGIQAAETIDRVIFNVLMGGTTVFYPGAVQRLVVLILILQTILLPVFLLESLLNFGS